MNYISTKIFSPSTLRLTSQFVVRSNQYGYLSTMTSSRNNIVNSISSQPILISSNKRFMTTESKPAAEESTKTEEKKELTLEEQIKDLKTQLEDKHSQLLYIAADRENVRKLGKEETDKAKKFGIQSFAKDLVEVVDQLEMALAQFNEAQLKENADLKSLHEGVQMTEKIFLKIMGNNGLERFDPLGEKFDYNLHNAIFEINDPTKENGTVGHVVKNGYKLNNRLVRAAQVGVVKSKPQ
ncbi:molecular chaperone [Cavenderia fasciculata]|uniref:GrpE protein homolog n=1 Tax=Cavenderia fasciculata TaxID=261658 RepID=F4PJ11_CACFS|nr:molecular chaperone [Cavenderia fasciculata]EGG24297.1 molecular chaperone [Cavenderia fasciculata]|eukprot:XP_004362148.1 molecular chaperone [Cavenderia fasciculata]